MACGRSKFEHAVHFLAVDGVGHWEMKMKTIHVVVWLSVLAPVSAQAQSSADAGVTKRAPAKQKRDSLESTDVRLVVDFINKGQLPLAEFFPKRVERKAVDAVSFRPAMMMGMGSLLIRFKHRAEALSEEEWAQLEAHATRLPATDSPARSLQGTTGERLAPRKQVGHLVINGRDETEWNHGESWGVTLLEGDAVVFWHEYW